MILGPARPARKPDQRPPSRRDRHPSVPDGETCPHCGSLDLFAVECTVGPHFGRVGCSGCGRFVRWLPAPMTLAKALRYQMPFGKWRFRPLSEVAESDPEYLEWLRTIDLKPTLRKAVDLVLAHHDAGRAR